MRDSDLVGEALKVVAVHREHERLRLGRVHVLPRHGGRARVALRRAPDRREHRRGQRREDGRGPRAVDRAQVLLLDNVSHQLHRRRRVVREDVLRQQVAVDAPLVEWPAARLPLQPRRVPAAHEAGEALALAAAVVQVDGDHARVRVAHDGEGVRALQRLGGEVAVAEHPRQRQVEQEAVEVDAREALGRVHADGAADEQVDPPHQRQPQPGRRRHERRREEDEERVQQQKVRRDAERAERHLPVGKRRRLRALAVVARQQRVDGDARDEARQRPERLPRAPREVGRLVELVAVEEEAHRQPAQAEAALTRPLRHAELVRHARAAAPRDVHVQQASSAILVVVGSLVLPN